MARLLDVDSFAPQRLKIIMAGFSKAELTVLLPAIALVFAALASGLFRAQRVQSRADDWVKCAQPNGALVAMQDQELPNA